MVAVKGGGRAQGRKSHHKTTNSLSPKGKRATKGKLRGGGDGQRLGNYFQACWGEEQAGSGRTVQSLPLIGKEDMGNDYQVPHSQFGVPKTRVRGGKQKGLNPAKEIK